MTITQESRNLSVTYSFKDILQKLLKSSINITPEALLYLTELNLSTLELEDFIRSISFSPNFGSHITINCIRSKLDKSIPQNPESQLQQNSQTTESLKDNNDSSLNTINSSTEDLSSEEIDFFLQNDDDNTILIQNNNENSNYDMNLDEIPDNPFEEETKPHQIVENKLQNKDLQPNPNNSTKNNLHSDSSDHISSKDRLVPQNKIESKPDGDFIEEQNLEEDDSTNEKKPEEDEDIARIRQEKRSSWEKLQLRQSTSTFRPIASEYPSKFEIIKDPTGKIFSEGKISDFISVQLDKFETIGNILKKRPESNGAIDISMINRLESSVEVKFIGMVVDKRQTASRNYIIEFEDPTGTCSVLVRQKTSNDLYDLMLKILPDHILLVDGYLSVRDSKSRIIMANNIVFPDTANTHDTIFPEEDIAACLISDTHFGSKDWLGKVWFRFIDYLNCRIGDDRQVEQAGKIKYITIAGDLVDGIGVYPNQDKRLDITDIYKQYEAVAELFSEIPDYITIIVTPGDHDAVRKAVPNPAISGDMAKGMLDLGVKLVGGPAYVGLHGIKTLMFHGTSLIDMNMSVPGLTNEDPRGTMVELIRARHLAPTYGKKTELAPTEKDWLVIDDIPDIIHTGHLHKNGCGWYHGILTVNSGCFQGQTDYMKSFGIDPDYGKPTIVNLKGPKLVPKVIDLVGGEL